MIKFAKMHGLGNDFVCMNYEKIGRYNLKIFSKFICDRHFGIGADGLILYSKSKIADFKMRIFNNDGTEAEMCGNGIRCLAKFLYEKKLTENEKVSIETLSGIKEVIYELENEKIMLLKVNMGTPQTGVNKLQVYTPRNYNMNQNICKLLFKIQDREVVGTFLSIGNPHTIIEVKDIKNYPVTKYGYIVENYKYFPQKTNVEFVQIINESNIKVRVWERGVGETLACGTGAVASAFAMYKAGKLKNEINVELKGGVLKIIIDEKKDEVWMEGPAVNIFEGEIDL